MNSPIIEKLKLKNGTELVFVPANIGDLIEMGFTEQEAKDHCDAAIESCKWQEIRVRRNRLLRETDFAEYSRKLSDADKAKFLAYRDKLFDIPQDFNKADDVVWPDMTA